MARHQVKGLHQHSARCSVCFDGITEGDGCIEPSPGDFICEECIPDEIESGALKECFHCAGVYTDADDASWTWGADGHECEQCTELTRKEHGE